MNKPHKILVVDDEPINLMMLEEVLRQKFQVVTATSAQEALEILNRQEFALLITDQRMPGMRGTELLRKAHTIAPDLVCLLLTAEKDTDTFIDAIVNSGAARVIHKPWESERLLQIVQSECDKYETALERKKSLNELKKSMGSLNRVVKGG